MAYNPGVSFFTPFHELYPSKKKQCIYFTQDGARCRWSCQESDNRRAIALHKTVNAISSEAISLDLLQEYVLCNCCISGRARHRDRIEDIGLLIPLARRWQDEIQRHADYTISVPAFEEYGSSGNSTTTAFAIQPFRSLPRYNLRPREANISTNSISTQSTSISQAPLSEFRPHVADPLPSDSVSGKIFDLLKDRDFETGSLYIFDRASSPGHVKIGWTADSVSGRLEDWSKCGYSPNLLFSVHCVPHALRVETLTHHELIKQWRRERRCKASWCGKSHQEWFEVSKERAAQVLGEWADFMKRAEPYDSKGWLKNRWREVVKMMDGTGEVVTAKKLLEHHKGWLVKEATLVKEPVGLGHAPKIKEEVGFGYIPKVGRRETLEETLVRVGSLRTEEPILPKETPLVKSEALPKQIPLVEAFLPKAEKEPKSDPLFKTELPPKTQTQSLSKTKPLFKTDPLFQTKLSPKPESPSGNGPLSQTEPQFGCKPRCEKLCPAKTTLFNTGPLPKSRFLFTAEPLFKLEPLSKTRPLFKTESLFKTKPLPESEPVHEEVTGTQTTPVKKELPPEQIQLPRSPLLQPLTFPQDTLSSQETKPSPSTGTEETGATDIITNSDTNITVVNTSSSPKTSSSVSPSAPASLSATRSEDIPPQTNAHTSTGTGTGTKSPPLNFSDASSEPNPSDSSATSASPTPKAEPVLNLSAPPVMEVTEALLCLSTNDQGELAETLTSSTQREQNVEGEGQVEPESEPLRCDGRTREEEIKSHDQAEGTVTEKETGTGADGWDAEETLAWRSRRSDWRS